MRNGLGTLDEWHEEIGNVLWWKFPIDEPPWVGTPNDSDWIEDHYTHWQHIVCPAHPDRIYD